MGFYLFEDHNLKLVAKLEVQLGSDLLVERVAAELPEFHVEFDAFELTVQFVGDLCCTLGNGTRQYLVNKLNVSVAGNVLEAPPEAPSTEQGGRDWSVQADYFLRPDSPIRKHYEVYETCLRRLTNYFKYELRQPNIDIRKASVQSSEFYDSNGKHVGSPPLQFTVPGVPGMRRPKLGCTFLDENRDGEVQRTLSRETPIHLSHEILSDAQAAAFDDNIRRSVLELAIACEVAIKSSFFHTDVSWSAYEFLSNRIHVSLLEFIHGVAKEAFGESFKDFAPDDFAHLDHLFRCRNKIAHGGEACFRDDSGTRQAVDKVRLGIWWDSVGRLLDWLDSKV